MKRTYFIQTFALIAGMGSFLMASSSRSEYLRELHEQKAQATQILQRAASLLRAVIRCDDYATYITRPGKEERQYPHAYRHVHSNDENLSEILTACDLLQDAHSCMPPDFSAPLVTFEPEKPAEPSNDYPDLASRRARLSAALRAFADTSPCHPRIKIMCRPKFIEFWISGMPKIVVAHTPLQSFGELRSQEELKTYFELIAACSMVQEESWEEVIRDHDGTISTRRLT